MIEFSAAALQIISRVSIFLFPVLFSKAFADWLINSILLVVILTGASFWFTTLLFNRSLEWKQKAPVEFAAIAGALTIFLQLAYEISMSAFASTISTFSQYVVNSTDDYTHNAIFLTFLCLFCGVVYIRMSYHDFPAYV